MAEVIDLALSNEERQPQFIAVLPLELLVEIFSYLNTRQDLISCCEVSKRFHAAAITPLLWKPLCWKVWRIDKYKDENWMQCYIDMYLDWGRYEECYADIRRAWDVIEKYTEEYCPALLHGLNNGATEEELYKAERSHFLDVVLPNDYRCSLRIHNGQKRMNLPSAFGSTSIANHIKREALLNVQTATSALDGYDQEGLSGCIPITLCESNTCGHYMAIAGGAGHKKGRVFWPSMDEESMNLRGNGRMHCFLMADNFTQWITSYAENLVTEHYPVIAGEIYAYKSASSFTSDNGITVRTATCFLPELSCINPPRFFFTYRITISMDSSFPKEASCQLATRHWYIVDGNGEKEEVHGEAVCGQYPRMIPGAIHDYVSCTSFTTPMGTMEGYYTFNFLQKAGTTQAKIAPMHFKAPPFETAAERRRRYLTGHLN